MLLGWFLSTSTYKLDFYFYESPWLITHIRDTKHESKEYIIATAYHDSDVFSDSNFHRILFYYNDKKLSYHFTWGIGQHILMSPIHQLYDCLNCQPSCEKILRKYKILYIEKGYKIIFAFENRFDNKSHKHYFRNFLPPPLIMLRHEKYTYIHDFIYELDFLDFYCLLRWAIILGLSLIFLFEIEKGRQNVYFSGAMSTTTHANMIIPLPLIILFLISTFYIVEMFFLCES